MFRVCPRYGQNHRPKPRVAWPISRARHSTHLHGEALEGEAAQERLKRRLVRVKGRVCDASAPVEAQVSQRRAPLQNRTHDGVAQLHAVGEVEGHLAAHGVWGGGREGGSEGVRRRVTRPFHRAGNHQRTL